MNTEEQTEPRVKVSKSQRKRFLEGVLMLEEIEIKFLKISSLLAVIATVPALIALVGIVSSNDILQSYSRSFPTMNLETVIGVLLVAFAIFVFNHSSLKVSKVAGAFKTLAVRALFSLVALFFLTLIYYIYYSIQLKEEQAVPAFFSSVRTSISLLFLGAILLLINCLPKWRNYLLLFLAIPFYIGIIAMTGYVIRATIYYRDFANTGMSIPTSFSVILLSCSIAIGPGRHAGDGIFLSSREGGRLIRQFLPVALFLPLLFTWVNLLCERHGLYAAQTSTVLQVVGPCFLLSAIICLGGSKLIRSEDKFEQKKEEHHILAKLNQAKDEFLAILSHELRTPMHIVQGYLQVLEETDPASDEYRNALTVIRRSAQSELHLVNSILELSRLVTGKMGLNVSAFDLRAMVESAFLYFKMDMEGKKLQGYLDVDKDNMIYNGDEARLQQVCWNLISNAIKFTPKGGQIIVSLKKEKSSFRLSIKDSGIGMTPEEITNVFQAFWQADASSTRKYGGLGLGLSLANHLVKAHGGEIQIQSEGIDKGTTVSVILPTN